MKSILVLLSVIFLTTACTKPQYNYIPKSIDVSEPPIGEVRTVNVGDILLRQGTYTEQDAIQVYDEFSVGLFGEYTFTPGYYHKVGEDKKSEFYVPEQGPYGGRVNVALLADPFQSMQIHKDQNKVCAITIFGGSSCAKNVRYSHTMRPSLTANSFQQTLIYSGRVGEKINIGYREFSSNLARPAFNNDVEYDLSSSNLIGYKGAELEVIEATNKFIKYRVIRNFNTQ